MVSMSTRGRSPALQIRRVASMPSSLGIRTSITTTSAGRVCSSRVAARPSPASPTTDMSSWASSTIRNPVRTSSWSSTSRIRMLMLRPPGPPPRAPRAGWPGQQLTPTGSVAVT